MANYICKECENNNHGWCKIKSRNKLKEIKECKDRHVKDDSPEVLKKTENKYINTTNKEVINTESYKVFGKREMLYHIQCQIHAMPKNSTIEEFKQVLLSLNQSLNIEEAIHGIAVEYMIDQDIIDNSKAIFKKWSNQINE